MANTMGALDAYLTVVKTSLEAAFCLNNFDSQLVERHNKPEVEMLSSNEVILKPLSICRTDMQQVLIEPSINSVRISIKIKQSNEIEGLLCNHFMRFMTRRAENFQILRRKPVENKGTKYDISFLITNFHLEGLIKEKLIDFIIAFIKEIDKEISEMRIML